MIDGSIQVKISLIQFQLTRGGNYQQILLNGVFLELHSWKINQWKYLRMKNLFKCEYFLNNIIEIVVRSLSVYFKSVVASVSEQCLFNSLQFTLKV